MASTSVRTVEVEAPFGTLSAQVWCSRGDRAPTGLKTVVVWPSVLSTAAVQHRLVEGLAREFAVVAVDPPGHGGSRIEDPDALTMTACARATWDLVDIAHDPVSREVRWVGTSWGGLVGIEAALLEPDRLAHLTCLNTPFAFESPTLLRPAWLPRLARVVGTSAVFSLMTARSFFLPATRSDATSAEAMSAHRATFRNWNRRQLAMALRLVFIDRPDARPRLAGVVTPTLVIGGAHDAMYPIDGQREAARLLPHGTFEVVDSAHIAAVDATDVVLAALQQAWCEDVAPSA